MFIQINVTRSLLSILRQDTHLNVYTSLCVFHFLVVYSTESPAGALIEALQAGILDRCEQITITSTQSISFLILKAISQLRFLVSLTISVCRAFTFLVSNRFLFIVLFLHSLSILDRYIHYAGLLKFSDALQSHPLPHLKSFFLDGI